MLYLSLKTLHIVFVASWFAGLFYLPRILVNMAEVRAADTDLAQKSAVLERLSLMATRLLRFMNILALPALGLGLWLWLGFGITGTWLWLKLVFVVAALGYHHSCGVLLRKFLAGNGRGGRWYRLYNEVPVLLMLVTVALVIFKPF